MLVIDYMEIRLIPHSNLQEALASFFAALQPDEGHFHPHPLTIAQTESLMTYTGRDLYYALTANGRILAYGMLRGWDEGYEIPSLGIAVAPESRSKGLGELMMLFLHAAARERGAPNVRLTVNADNYSAIRLYKRLAYQLEDRGDGTLLGLLTLKPTPASQ